MGLSGLYRSDEQFALAIRQLAALAFVPLEMVAAFFGTAAQLLENHHGLTAEQQNQVCLQFVIK